MRCWRWSMITDRAKEREWNGARLASIIFSVLFVSSLHYASTLDGFELLHWVLFDRLARRAHYLLVFWCCAGVANVDEWLWMSLRKDDQSLVVWCLISS